MTVEHPRLTPGSALALSELLLLCYIRPGWLPSGLWKKDSVGSSKIDGYGGVLVGD